jgi:uncharacterized membrane protein (DUF4010 family)
VLILLNRVRQKCVQHQRLKETHMSNTESILMHFMVALGIGLLIGLERERRKGVGPARSAAGIRTFAVASLLGAVSVRAGGDVLLAVAAAGIIGLAAVSYDRNHGDDPGLTTEVALVLTLVLGGLAMREPGLAAALSAVAAILLAARAPLHRFVRDVLTEAELRDALILSAATLIVWPLLPDRYLGPFSAINPSKIWTIVILLMAIGAGGHVAVRALGARFGLPVSGFASGFASSAATIGAMGARASANPDMVGPAAAGAVLSNVATAIQLAALLEIISPPALATLWFPLLSAGLAAAVYGGVLTLKGVSSNKAGTDHDGAAFSVSTTLLLAAILSAVLVGAAALSAWLGQSGVFIATAAAGVADVHAAAFAAGSQVAKGNLSADQGVWAVLLGITSNSITKIILAATAGTREFAAQVVPGILFFTVAAWGSATLGRLQF